MKTLRRYELRDRLYFVTVVTHHRESLLLIDPSLFRLSWGRVELVAWVLLPDHFHAIIEVGVDSISDMLHAFKIKYSRRFRDSFRPGRVWQNRFWEHVIRDEGDLNRHTDYIHYNPVKHEISRSPFDYRLSSLDDYFRCGLYERDWGVKELVTFEGEFGE